MRKEKFLEGEFYHIYNRGNSKQKIFHDFEDYDRFKKLMFVSNGTKRFEFKENFILLKKDPYEFEKGNNLVKICAWVLMPNHFHIFLTPGHPVSPDCVNDFIRKLTMAYSKYYNKKYSRTGSLFEGRFKSRHVNSDNYFRYLFSYIHLNPVKLIQNDWKEEGIKNLVKAKNYLNNFQHSSYFDYFKKNSRKESGIISKDIFLSRIDKNTNLEKEIFVWLSHKD